VIAELFCDRGWLVELTSRPETALLIPPYLLAELTVIVTKVLPTFPQLSQDCTTVL
jgi:hypothetical protein